MTVRDNLRYLLRGPGTSSFRSPLALPMLSITETTPTLRTSLVFDSHMQEANATPQNISVAWDERESKGISDSTSTWLGLSARERKEILLSIYLANPWVSDCVDVIANRIASGGYVIEEVKKGQGTPKNHDTLEAFLLRINDDWDFLQIVRSCIADILIYGETFVELTWQGNQPYQMYLIDCVTMRTKHDAHGRATDFMQQLESQSAVNHLDPKNIIRWWRPHPKAKVDPFSPIEKVQDAVLAEGKMVKWVQTFFQKGAKFPFYIEGGENWDRSEAERYKVYFEQNNTGEKNAHMPVITYGGTKLVPIGRGAIDIDFEHGRDRNRTEIISAFHVPPAIVSIIESGNIGGGTGEDQDKSFQYNACDPIKQLFFEKFNDRITKRGFGITDWRVSSKYADFRNDKDLAEVQDKRIRNGSRTINEARQEDGKEPYENGGDIAVIVTTKEITPVPRLDDMEEEARSTAQAAIQTAQANADLATTKAKQAKEPPPEPPPSDGTSVPKAAHQAQPPGQTNASVPAVKPPPLATPAKSESAMLSAEDWRHITDLMEKQHAEQTTHPQSETSDALAKRSHTQTSNGPLHPLLPAMEEQQSRVTEETQSDSDQHKAELAIALAALFLAMQRRGSASLASLSGALLAYSFTSDEKNQFIHELAEAYLWGQMWAFTRAFTSVGMTPPAGASLFTESDALAWATGQASGIFETYTERFSTFAGALSPDLPADEAIATLDDWLTRYSDYKAPQIANYTVGVGVNEGARTAVNDMLDALTNVGIDTSGIPDGLSAEQIRVRVVPSSSSSDMCSEWAGKDFPLADAGDIPYFPAHPNCIHSIEVYVDDGGVA